MVAVSLDRPAKLEHLLAQAAADGQLHFWTGGSLDPAKQ